MSSIDLATDGSLGCLKGVSLFLFRQGVKSLFKNEAAVANADAYYLTLLLKTLAFLVVFVSFASLSTKKSKLADLDVFNPGKAIFIIFLLDSSVFEVLFIICD